MGAVILNGRHVGDKEGDFTFFRGPARSVIEYVACSYGLLNFFSDFSIPVKEFSDHMPLTVTLSFPKPHSSSLAISHCKSNHGLLGDIFLRVLETGTELLIFSSKVSTL